MLKPCALGMGYMAVTFRFMDMVFLLLPGYEVRIMLNRIEQSFLGFGFFFSRTFRLNPMRSPNLILLAFFLNAYWHNLPLFLVLLGNPFQMFGLFQFLAVHFPGFLGSSIEALRVVLDLLGLDQVRHIVFGGPRLCFSALDHCRNLHWYPRFQTNRPRPGFLLKVAR